MARVCISLLAQADFDDVVDYLKAAAGARTAEKYGRRIQAAINGLTEFPDRGSPRPELGADVRIALVDPYLIFYESLSEQDLVLVLRIFHGHQNITADQLAPE